MIKSKRELFNQPNKQKETFEQVYVIQKIARIDGNQTIKKYKKCELLGKGGFANCYVTINQETKKKAATKIIQKQLLTSQKTKLRLLNEIRLHKTLHHQNVVQFQHYFQDKNNVYIFLELCQNQSLNELIKQRQYFSTPEIQSFLYGIINGLKYLHGKSIIHRDLKLGNIFLDNNFCIKLGDFGLATKLEFKKENKRTICGTPNYIAPQILEGKGYHFQVDIWSIGVILYTLYYTIPPFETEEAITTYQKIKKCQYTIPKNLLVPYEANELIRKILVKNPYDRPTLDDILKSDFMRLGNIIYMQLPPICSSRMPNKKDLSGMKHITYSQLLMRQNNNNPISYNQNQMLLKTQVNEQDSISFISFFESLGQEMFYYVLNNAISAIFTANQVIFKDQYGSIKSFNPKDNLINLKSCQVNPLKSLLNCKDKLRNGNKLSCNHNIKKQVFLEATLYPTQIPLFVKRIFFQSKHKFHMIRLSNQTIQFIFDDGFNYLLDGKGKKIYVIKNEKLDQTIILSNSFEINQKEANIIGVSKSKYIIGVLNQIKAVKEKIISKNAAKQNIINEVHSKNRKKQFSNNIKNQENQLCQRPDQRKLFKVISA